MADGVTPRNGNGRKEGEDEFECVRRAGRAAAAGRGRRLGRVLAREVAHAAVREFIRNAGFRDWIRKLIQGLPDAV